MLKEWIDFITAQWNCWNKQSEKLISIENGLIPAFSSKYVSLGFKKDAMFYDVQWCFEVQSTLKYFDVQWIQCSIKYNDTLKYQFAI